MTDGEIANLFKLASDPTRLKVILLLGGGPACGRNVTELCAALGHTQPAVSHHLALLRVAGVIAPRRVGKNNYYELLEPGRVIAGVAAHMARGAGGRIAPAGPAPKRARARPA